MRGVTDGMDKIRRDEWKSEALECQKVRDMP